jgi:class 3 adenylate cyclase
LAPEVEPPTGFVTIVFTDVRNSTQLWEKMSIPMRVAIREHNLIMRRNLRFFNGYEVKTEGDAFMVSFKGVLDALRWCLTVQLQLLCADWPQEILDSNDGKEVYGPSNLDGEGNTLLYRGLSIRMGLHCGTPVSELDPITRRMDYFGPMVNKTSRVCGAAEGGQILVSQDVERAYHNERAESSAESNKQRNNNDKWMDLIQLDPLFISVGEKKLKGFENLETLVSVMPRALVGRHHIPPPPPVGAPEGKESKQLESETIRLTLQNKRSSSMVSIHDLQAKRSDIKVSLGARSRSTTVLSTSVLYQQKMLKDEFENVKLNETATAVGNMNAVDAIILSTITSQFHCWTRPILNRLENATMSILVENFCSSESSSGSSTFGQSLKSALLHENLQQVLRPISTPLFDHPLEQIDFESIDWISPIFINSLERFIERLEWIASAATVGMEPEGLVTLNTARQDHMNLMRLLLLLSTRSVSKKDEKQ